MEGFCKDCFDIIDGTEAAMNSRKNQVQLDFDNNMPVQVYTKHK